MKRLCTEREKEWLLYNRKRLCLGVFASNIGLMQAAWAMFASFVIGFIACIFLPDFFDIPETGATVRRIFSIAFIIFTPIVAIVYKKLRINREQKKLLKANEIFVNGATIVGADNENKRLLYVEDDVCDEKGSLILFSCPSNEMELKTVTGNERALIIYDAEGGSNLMKINSAIADFFRIGYSPVFSKSEILKKEAIPHLNALNIEKEERDLSSEESEALSYIYAKLSSLTVTVISAIIGVILIGLVMSFAVLNGQDTGELKHAVKVGLIICGAICVGIYIIHQKCQSYYQNKYQFISIKEVLMDYYEYVDSKTEIIHVFEWEDKKLELKGYQNAGSSTYMRYGGILFKLKSSENKVVLLSKNELIKKNMIE